MGLPDIYIFFFQILVQIFLDFFFLGMKVEQINFFFLLVEGVFNFD